MPPPVPKLENFTRQISQSLGDFILSKHSAEKLTQVIVTICRCPFSVLAAKEEGVAVEMEDIAAFASAPPLASYEVTARAPS